MTNEVMAREDYWAGVYFTQRREGVLQPPSQFAAFVAQEVGAAFKIIDVGCGNGRDSLFFAALGFKVFAIDQSEEAVQMVQQKAKERGNDNLACAVGSVTEPLLETILRNCGDSSLCVYARFFLHAVSEGEQAVFFETLAKWLKPGDKIAFEYRTTADQFLEKTAAPHYRRYQPASHVNSALKYLGFSVLYEREGQGFAKFGPEDAIVARVIFEKGFVK